MRALWLRWDRTRRKRSRPAALVASALVVWATLLAGCATGPSAAAVIPTATAGAIRLVPDRASYAVSEPVGITVSNVSSSDEYAVTGHSACTFLQLEVWDGQGRQWTNTDPCVGSQSTQALLIRSGMQEPFTLTPSSTANANAWAPGTYRVSLSYSPQSNGTGGAQVAYSSGFTIA
jgi:hypothetical protein